MNGENAGATEKIEGKIFETSIVPQGSKLYQVQPAKIVLPTLTLEVVHVFIFLCIILVYFLYAPSSKK
jgi:hypothetical protein